MEYVDVRAAQSANAYPRIGIVVPRYVHDAVARNRLKRRLRELARTRLIPAIPAVDVVIRALPSAYGASFSALEQQIQRAAGLVAAECGAS